MNFEATVHDFIDREFAPKRHAAKLLAKAAGGISPRTAENWLRRICSPKGDELISLMAECESLKAEILRLVEERKNT